MPACPKCKNMNVVTDQEKGDILWCRNCGYTPDGSEIRLAADARTK